MRAGNLVGRVSGDALRERPPTSSCPWGLAKELEEHGRLEVVLEAGLTG
jgi:hypothetical protein